MHTRSTLFPTDFEIATNGRAAALAGQLGQDAEYLRRHGADEAVMQPHRYAVG